MPSLMSIPKPAVCLILATLSVPGAVANPLKGLTPAPGSQSGPKFDLTASPLTKRTLTLQFTDDEDETPVKKGARFEWEIHYHIISFDGGRSFLVGGSTEYSNEYKDVDWGFVRDVEAIPKGVSAGLNATFWTNAENDYIVDFYLHWPENFTANTAVLGPRSGQLHNTIIHTDKADIAAKHATYEFA